VANTVPQLSTERITITFPAIQSSKKVIFLVNDPSKEEAVTHIFSDTDLPASRVNRLCNDITWIIGE